MRIILCLCCGIQGHMKCCTAKQTAPLTFVPARATSNQTSCFVSLASIGSYLLVHLLHTEMFGPNPSSLALTSGSSPQMGNDQLNCEVLYHPLSCNHLYRQSSLSHLRIPQHWWRLMDFAASIFGVVEKHTAGRICFIIHVKCVLDDKCSTSTGGGVEWAGSCRHT